MLTGLLLLIPTLLFSQEKAPLAVAPVPSARQVEWQRQELCAFIHFGPNTFLSKEWGYGDAPLSCFNPKKLDCEQWARTLKAAGMTTIILTAKHHDGFCLWPTAYTDYSVRNSPFRQGHGDVVGELAAACRKYGMKIGIYLSPWDRHQAFYGTSLYPEYYLAQLRELLTNYGEVDEVWFDSANGGDGWYGGAREDRHIDKRTYYDFPRIFALVKELQPNAIIMSDAGPGCRSVGNERGKASPTNWSFIRSKDVYPGYPNYWEFYTGHKDGDEWAAGECDVSIRPSWFWRKSENESVKSVDRLMDIYYLSVGHNGKLLLNVPVDTDGLIHPIDSARVISFHNRLKKEFKTNLFRKKATIKTSSVRGKQFATSNLADGNYDTYWSVGDDVMQPSLTIIMRQPTKINRLMLQEYIPLGQRVEEFRTEWWDGKKWLPLKLNEETTTIGYKRLLRFEPITARQMRITFVKSRGPVCINEIGAYFVPNATDQLIKTPIDIKGLPFTVKEQTPREVTFDLGSTQKVSAFYYLPDQSTEHRGLVANYELYVGDNLDSLKMVSSGEFANIQANPMMQEVHFAPASGRYVRLKATRIIKEFHQLGFDKIAIK